MTLQRSRVSNASVMSKTNQKYTAGTRVKIADTLPDYMRFFPAGKKATVTHTHPNRRDIYSLDIDGHGEVAWYEEDHINPLANATA